jgi:DNA-binding PadR family transcriptional regulator
MTLKRGGNSRPDLLQGTLDMLVLQTLRLGPAHGYTIARTI